MNHAIRPIHHSFGGRPRLPNNMEKLAVPPEIKDGLTDDALSIWTDCINAGQPLQVALLAVYLSGLQHGAALGATDAE